MEGTSHTLNVVHANEPLRRTVCDEIATAPWIQVRTGTRQ